MDREPNTHDEAPSIIEDHPYEPEDEWWSLCKVCRLAQAAHSSSTPEAYAAKELYFATLPRPTTEEMIERERSRLHQGGRIRIGYVGDDDDD